MTELTLPLNDIIVDNNLNPREGALDQEAVLEYSQYLNDLPPMHIFDVPNVGYLLVAGFHRMAAHKLAGAETGRFIVHQGDRQAAEEFADLDNLRHGIQLTRKERRQVIRRQLKRHPERSDVWLARDCHTTDKTVRSVREELEAASEIPTLDKLVGQNGIEKPRSITRPAPKPEPPGTQLAMPVEDAPTTFTQAAEVPSLPPPVQPAAPPSLPPLPPPIIGEAPWHLNITIYKKEGKVVYTLRHGDNLRIPLGKCGTVGLPDEVAQILERYLTSDDTHSVASEAEWLTS